MISRIGPVTERPVHRRDRQRTPTAARYIPAVNTNGAVGPGDQPRPARHRRHQPGPGPLPQRGHRHRTGRRAWRGGRATARHRPRLPGRAHLGRRAVVLRHRHPAARRARPGDRHLRPGRVPAPPRKYLGFDGHPSTIYLRAAHRPGRRRPRRPRRHRQPREPRARSTSASPQPPSSRGPKAKSALNGLFLGLGAVALLVGAVGVANIMIISVLERRSEIGLRRALGATRGHIRTQFLSEAILLALLGGAAGVAAGVLATADLRHHQALGHRHPHARLGRRARRRPPHRRGRRLLPGAARRPHVPHRGPLDYLGLPLEMTARDCGVCSGAWPSM